MSTELYPKCTHDEWIKICVICGDVIDDSTLHETGTASKTHYVDYDDGAIGGGG